jgi:hypothetical protein
MDWAGPGLINKRLLVCRRCLDTPQDQLRSILIPADPIPILNPRPQNFEEVETDTRVTSGQNTVDFWTGLPVPGGNTRITQDDQARVTQATGSAPGSFNPLPGVPDPNDLYGVDYGRPGPRMEATLKAITLIPATGDFAYATQEIFSDGVSQNAHTGAGTADIIVSVDQLIGAATALEQVSLVISWFGTDLRADQCLIQPGVDSLTTTSTPKTWVVDGVARADAHLISTGTSGSPNYGGTPADFSVVQAITLLKAKGLRICFYPFILMDIPAGNVLPNPYSANAATLGQAVLPWRGRITCSPAPGQTGTVDQTATAATQVDAFFGSATASDFTVSGTDVSYIGTPGDWGYRRMVLHYALLCQAAGGVDSFLIGSEMRGLTTTRSSVTDFPTVTQLGALLTDIRAILGDDTEIGYAADWTEYFGYQPGSGDVFFHLDPLWSDAECDFVGIDNYMPLSDWRDSGSNLDGEAGWNSVYNSDYLMSNIEGGEGYDWYYASDANRTNQIRTTISDGSYDKPWVFRYKDFRNWWLNEHYDRTASVESVTPTAWVPESKPIRFTEFGCPAVDLGTNQPNVFVDPKSSESALPYFSSGASDQTIQRAAIEAILNYWGDQNTTSTVYGANMLDLTNSAAWTWDARPWPYFPDLTTVWSDGPNWETGHWLTGRLGQPISDAETTVLYGVEIGLPYGMVDVPNAGWPIPEYWLDEFSWDDSSRWSD